MTHGWGLDGKVTRRFALQTLPALAGGVLLSDGAAAQNLRWLPPKTGLWHNAYGSAPSLAVFGGQLFAAWAGCITQQIYFSSIAPGNPSNPANNATWAPTQQLRGVATSVGPSLATFQGKLFAAWKGMNNDEAIYFSSFANNAWVNQRSIPNAVTSVGPSLAVFNGRLFAAWKGGGSDQSIYFASFDGSNWTPPALFRGVGTSHGPAIISAFGTLLAAWKGIEGDSGIYYSTFDGRGWASQKGIENAATAVGPSLVVMGRVFAAWRGAGADQQLYWSSYDGGPRWTGQSPLLNASSTEGASLAVVNGWLFACWFSPNGLWGCGFPRQMSLAAAVPGP